MAKPGGVTHLFAELSSLDELGSLLGRSARLKYTCLSVSKKYLALGSNSGGVYIFSRDTLKYLQVVFGDKETSLVINVSLSPSDQHVAIALSTGHVAVHELNIDRRTKPERVRYSQDHIGHTVTALTWDASSSKVFAGDSTGKLSTIFVPTNKSKNLFNLPSEVIAYVECSVYQMEWWKDKLLVSTLTHTHLFDTIKQNYSTIGTKARDGEYGACFYVEPSSKYTVIYCARPGSRIWEVDFDGKVLNTHQLKQLLAVPPVPVVKLGSDSFDCVTTPQTGQTVNFYKMFHISQFIITWSSKGLYLFDPINVKVMIWSQSFKGIKDINVHNNDVYLFLESGSIHRLTLLPIYQLFTALSSRALWSLSSNILLAVDQVGMRLAVVKRVKKDLLPNILAGLIREDKNDVAEKIKASMEDISEGSNDSVDASYDFMNSAEVKGHTYLPSGMVIVSEGVQVKRVWDKSDQKVTILDKVDTSGTDEVGSVYAENIVDKDNDEYQSKVNMNNSFKNKFTEESKQEESVIYEQIKNSDLFNQNKIEENDISPSRTFNVSEIVGLDSDNGLDSENNAHLQNTHFDAQMNTDIDIVSLVKNTLFENNEFTEVSNSVRGNEPSVQIWDDGMLSSDENIPDLTVNHSFSENSSNETIFRSTIQQAHIDTNASSQQSTVLDTWSESKDIQFLNGRFQAINDLDSEQVISQQVISPNDDQASSKFQRTIGLSDNSGETSPTMSQGKVNDDNHYTRSENTKPPFTSTSIPNNVAHSAQSTSVLSGENIAELSPKKPQDASDVNSIESISQTRNTMSEVEFLATLSQLETPQYVMNAEILQENSNHKSLSPVQPTSHAQLEVAIEKMAARNKDIVSVNSNHTITKFISPKPIFGHNSDIAQPIKISKKKKRKSNDLIHSNSVDVNSSRTNKGTLRKTASFGDDQSDPFVQGLDLEMDSISIATISSIEEEDTMASPDSVASAWDMDGRDQLTVRTFSPELSSSPNDILGKPSSRKSSISSSHDERSTEVILPLIDRLAAARGSANNDDTLLSSHQDSLSSSPLSSGTGEHIQSSGSPRASLSALKDGLSLKLKTQTKSFIKTFKEKNLLTKSASTPMFPTSQQLERSQRDVSSPDGQQSDKVAEVDESKRIMQSAITAANITDLYISALNIQKQLRSSSAIVRPEMLQKILNEWAKELILAMIRYHEELLKRTNEIQQKENELEPSVSGNGGNTEQIDSFLRTELMNETNHGADSTSDVCHEYSNSENSQENQITTANNPTDVILVSASDQTSSELSSPVHKSPAAPYWTNVIHSSDPFQLPKKHLDLFRTLSTMCCVCGVTGDILSYLNFTEEIHYKTFVKVVLPSSLYSMFSPDCDCLMSLPHDSHMLPAEHNHQQNNRNNYNTEFVAKNTQQSQSFISSDISTGTNYISEGNFESSILDLNDTSLIHETESQNKFVHEVILKTCSCKINSTNWMEHEKFKQDVSLALFTRLFLFSLNFERVKQAIDNHNMLITWTSLVLCSREMGTGDIVSSILADQHINSAIDHLRSGIIPHQSALLGHIYRLFELIPTKASDFCGEIWKAVTPVDLVQMCSLCSKPASAYILRYFKQAMITLATVMRPTVFKQLCKHRDVRYLLLETILQPQATDVSIDGIRSLTSQLKAVLPFDWLNILLSLIASEEERDRIIQFCFRNGDSTICVQLLKETDQWQKLLQLIIQFNNINLLRGTYDDDGYVPRNEQEWKFLLNCFHEKWSAQLPALDSQKIALEDNGESLEAQHSNQHHFDRPLPSSSYLQTGVDTKSRKSKFLHQVVTVVEQAEPPLTAGTRPKSEDLSVKYESFSSKSSKDDSSKDNTISWHSLGYLLLEHVGGAAAIDLLMEYLHDPIVAKNCLKAEFLNACYMDFSIKMEQDHVTHEILEKLSVYMWKKKPEFVPPSVFHSMKAEKTLVEREEGEDDTVQGLFNQVKALESKDLMSEYLGGQWGQEVNMSSNCLCCNIPLKSMISLTIQGVKIFPCGHGFHKTCVSTSVCPMTH